MDTINSQRRRVLLSMGAGGVAWLAWRATWQPASAATSPACVITPEQMEGPYFIDEMLNRADIRTDPTDGTTVTGIPLQLQLRIHAVNGTTCTPLPKALVDIWHCDANGVYSGVQDSSFDTVGKKFLRGHQITDSEGNVTFTTIYPGWYPGRTVHIHVKVRVDTADGKAQEFTSQLYFDDAFTDEVYKLAPYNSREARFPRNDGDGIFRRANGDKLLLQLAGDASGYIASLDIGMAVG